MLSPTPTQTFEALTIVQDRMKLIIEENNNMLNNYISHIDENINNRLSPSQMNSLAGLHAKILQYKLDDLTLISGYEWGDEEGDPYVMPMPDGTDGRLSHIVAHSENQARRDSNATNIRWIKSMNKELRDLLSELIEVESDEGLVMLESMQMEYTSYNLQLKLYSLETLSQDVQDLITDKLLKMENRALVERVKGMILYLRLRLIWEERVRKTGRRDLERVLMLPPRRG